MWDNSRTGCGGLVEAVATVPVAALRSTWSLKASRAVNSRRLVLCLDGTWNNAYRLKHRTDGEAVLKPSNVLKTARAVVPHDPVADREQLVYYDVGVGSTVKYRGMSNRMLAATDRILGGSWGAGFEGNIEEALAFLVLNHQPGDEVFIFGFSRGAAAAQAVTRFIDWAGGLPVKSDAYYLPILFQGYIDSRGAETREAICQRLKVPPLDPFRPIDVVFLGVWDTVMALGPRFRARGAHTSTASRSFHVGPQPARCVRHARQALAVDEVRYDFRPELWTEPAAPGQTLRQRWFAGVHSNIGGGYVDDGLANLALGWMIGEAKQQGLAVDHNYLKKFRGYAQDRLYRSESPFYRTSDAVRWRNGRGKRLLTNEPSAAGFSLDVSVFHRIRADPAKRVPGHPEKLLHPDLKTLYRPENVLSCLAKEPDLTAYLQSIGLSPPELPADVMRRIEGHRSPNRRWRLRIRRT